MTTPCPNVEASTQRNNSEYHIINMDNPPMNEVLESSSQETRKEPLSAEGGDPALLVARREAENELVSCMKEKMLLYSVHDVPDPFAVCIYKVPEKLLKVNEEAYTPRIVSIGPFHHGKPHLQAMQRYKWRCLDRFLEGPGLLTNLNVLVKIAMNMESSVRACYHETFDHLTTQQFSEMVMLDGIFIVELFLENARVSWDEEDVVIFYLKFMKNDILHDMLLLENQLPLFVLQKLFSLVSSEVPIYDFAHEYFEKVGITDTLQKQKPRDLNGRHLLDFLRNCHLPQISTIDRRRHRHRRSGKLVHTRSATVLQKAGVKFSKGTQNCLFEVTLNTSEGILTIPLVIVNEWTHSFFGNLIAFEQCGRGETKEITSYIILMDSLINTCEDVDLLVKAGIIKNLLGDNQLVADLFNNLYKETVTDSYEFYYAEVCEDLNEYSRDYWHRWKAALFKWKRMLSQDYFSNPWSTISVIAAIILLALTAIQTASSIVQMKFF